jgi:hypothetical protein
LPAIIRHRVIVSEPEDIIIETKSPSKLGDSYRVAGTKRYRTAIKPAAMYGSLADVRTEKTIIVSE